MQVAVDRELLFVRATGTVDSTIHATRAIAVRSPVPVEAAFGMRRQSEMLNQSMLRFARLTHRRRS